MRQYLEGYRATCIGEIGDVNGDGHSDFVVCGAAADARVVMVVGGSDGSLMHVWGPRWADRNHYVIDDEWQLPLACAIGDVDGDGREDVAIAWGRVADPVGQSGHVVDSEGAVSIYSSRDWSMQYKIRSTCEGFGSWIAAPERLHDCPRPLAVAGLRCVHIIECQHGHDVVNRELPRQAGRIGGSGIDVAIGVHDDSVRVLINRFETEQSNGAPFGIGGYVDVCTLGVDSPMYSAWIGQYNAGRHVACFTIGSDDEGHEMLVIGIARRHWPSIVSFVKLPCISR